jgi:hypothetical protein
MNTRKHLWALARKQELSPMRDGTGTLRSWSPLVSATILCAVVMAILAVALAPAAGADPLAFSSFSLGPVNADGTPSTQAGAHPWELNTAFELNTVFSSIVGTEIPGQALKTSTFSLPAGVLGDPGAMLRCSQADMDRGAYCPTSTQIGVAEADVRWFGSRIVIQAPVFNMQAPPDEPAQFAFFVIASVVHIDVNVRTGGDYGVNATVTNANGTAPIYGVTLHLWGVPADSSHDGERWAPGAGCPGSDGDCGQPDNLPLSPSQEPRVPFIRNPTSCGLPLTTTASANSYQEPGRLAAASATVPAMTGCDRLPFDPTIAVAPDSRRAGAAAGMDIDVNVPQNRNPDGLASADVERVVMKLPSGVAINPSAGDGLQGCSDDEFGLHSATADSCPDGSKIGTLQLTSPLLQSPLTGTVFLASPLNQGPAAAAAGQMYRLFLEAQGSGVTVKLAGSVVPDPVTGQLVATFDNNPQLPFTNLHLALDGGSRAPLALPKSCGTYTTQAQLTSWASSTPVEADSSFTLDQSCDQASMFQPALEGGLTNPIAGGSSSFTMTLSRPDGQQDISALDLTLPPGLLARVGSVPLCPDAQAAAGSCPATSQIGRVSVAAGAGSNPLWVPQAGKTPTAVYLAGPYKGAPFSLSVVVPAQAGPFDLGSVVVRAGIFIDSHDAHVTVVSDPIPTILSGVPLDVQSINVTLDRPGFMVSPTNCDPMPLAARVSSAQGAVVGVSNRFQVGGCRELSFAPTLTASVQGKASRRSGASLQVKLQAGAGGANIRSVKVDLPKQLPSRLTTLQKACTALVFEANPANCPAASIVGHATATTPLLAVPVSGPAYFVSHGGEAFPSLIVVLQGDGVTIDLVGTTFISKAGITSSTFKEVPDVPVQSFQLTLPTGPFSALAANLPKASYSFCGQSLSMPTAITGQNGTVLKPATKIAVTGCPKAKKKHTATKTKTATKQG